MPGSKFRRRLRLVTATGFSLFALTASALIFDGGGACGHRPVAERLARMQASPQWSDGGFVNPQPMWNDIQGSLTGWRRMSPHAEPDGPLPVVTGDRRRFAAPPSSGLRVTWLGHSTQIIEIDGVTVLTDPIFGGRAAPFTWAGPAPWYPPPIPLSELPPLDAVLISHDHYDHLQVETIQAMAGMDTTFIAPLGVGAHLAYWGVPEGRIVEVDWWEEVTVGGLTITATPSRHASGRHLLDQTRTLWVGYALISARHRVFFSGDTGLFPDLAVIGERLGPFDLTMFEVGAYDRNWPDWHLGPEQAVRAHQMVRGDLLMPIHWGMWNLALHGWTEPAERVLVEVERLGVRATIPRPGESFEPARPPPLARWWPDVPWQTVEEHPIVARGMD